MRHAVYIWLLKNYLILHMSTFLFGTLIDQNEENRQLVLSEAE